MDKLTSLMPVLSICNLPAPEFRERHAYIRRLLEDAVTIALPDGVEFRVPASAETAHALVDFILFEKVCCSAITYALCSVPDHSSLVLRLTAPQTGVPGLHTLYLDPLESTFRSQNERQR